MTDTTTSSDQIRRFMLDDCDIRGEIVTLEHSYQQASEHQNLAPATRFLLGEFLAATTLLAEVLKFEGILTLQVRGSGPVPLIMAETTDERHLRGIVKLRDDVGADALEGLSFTQMIGNGVLTLTIDPRKGSRYQGIVPAEGDTLAECLTNYFAQSEQLKTRFWLAADNQKAAGLLLQALPNPDPQGSGQRSHELWTTAAHLANTVKPEELLQLDQETLLYRLFNEFDIRLYDPQPVSFACSCSRERSARALLSLGRDDAYTLLAERDIIETSCEFCGTQYHFGEPDLATIFGSANDDLH